MKIQGKSCTLTVAKNGYYQYDDPPKIAGRYTYTRHEGKNGGWYDLCENPPNDWENGDYPNKPIVEFLIENGYKIKVLLDLKDITAKYGIEESVNKNGNTHWKTLLYKELLNNDTFLEFIVNKP